MKVIAIRTGYFGRLRSPGERFDVPDDAQASWFLPDEAPPSEMPPPEAPKPERKKKTKDSV